MLHQHITENAGSAEKHFSFPVRENMCTREILVEGVWPEKCITVDMHVSGSVKSKKRIAVMRIAEEVTGIKFE